MKIRVPGPKCIDSDTCIYYNALGKCVTMKKNYCKLSIEKEYEEGDP